MFQCNFLYSGSKYERAKSTTEVLLQNGDYELQMPIFAWNGSQMHRGIRKQVPNLVRAFMVIRPTWLKDKNDGHRPFISWTYDHISKEMQYTEPNMPSKRQEDSFFTIQK